ncbi:MAG TPA: putative sulfate exporter family transporter, partial [Pararhizobium sp.]|nr:putative sulfate exporter family transporter [Pararhizobium sp.]
MTTFQDAAAKGDTAAGAHSRSTGGKAGILPGLLLAGAIAAAATALHDIPGIGTLSPLILAIILGMAFHNLIGTPVHARPGVKFSQQRILRLAIILLGFQLTFEQVMVVGPTGFAVIAITLVSTFVFTT